MDLDTPSNSNDFDAQLDSIKQSRGFLLPHQRLFAIAAPRLFKASGEFYEALALERRVLSRRDQKFVWVTMLLSIRERIPVHHLQHFQQEGATDADVETALRVAAFAAGASQYEFLAAEWQPQVPSYDAAAAYRGALTALLAERDVARGLVEVALAATQVLNGRFWAVAHHIREAYAHGVDEAALCEAMSLASYPGNMAWFIKSCQIWLDLIAAGEVDASEPFRQWAADSRQNRVD